VMCVFNARVMRLQCACLFNRHDASRCRSYTPAGFSLIFCGCAYVACLRGMLTWHADVALPHADVSSTGSRVPSVSCPGSTGAPQQRGPLTPQTQTRPNRLHTHIYPPKRLAHPRSPIPHLSTLTSRATHARPTSPRSTGFCAIWGCISSSSSSASGSSPSCPVATPAGGRRRFFSGPSISSSAHAHIRPRGRLCPCVKSRCTRARSCASCRSRWCSRSP